MFKKVGVIFLVAFFLLSIAGATFAVPPWVEEDIKKIPPGQQKKMNVTEEENYAGKKTGPPSFVLQKQEEQRLRFLEREQIRICGKELISDLPPVIKDGRTLIPVRAVVMGLGAEIYWDKEERLVTVKKGDITVEFYIDEKVFYVNGEKRELDVPAQLLSNRTFVPLRYLVEALGKRVKYDREKDKIIIGDDVLEYLKIGGVDVIDFEGIEVNDLEKDKGAILKVADFGDFAGIAVKAHDKENTSLKVYMNGSHIDEDKLDKQPLEEGDVIVVKAEVKEEEDGDVIVTTYYYKVTLVGIPSAVFVFEKPSGLVETDEDISGFSITVKRVRNIKDNIPLRYLFEVTRGDLDGKIIVYGDPPEAGFMIEDNKAYFGPPSGFTINDLPELTSDVGITTPFTVLDGLKEGVYGFKISILEVGGDSLVTSNEFIIVVGPAGE